MKLLLNKHTWESHFAFATVYIPHCFMRLPSDSIMAKDVGIESRTVATFALVVR
jgi:hypothetical protein